MPDGFPTWSRHLPSLNYRGPESARKMRAFRSDVAQYAEGFKEYKEYEEFKER